MDTSVNLTPYLFGAITLAGVLYFVYSLVFGEMGGDHAADAHIDVDTHIGGDTHGDGGEFGCMIVAAFLAAFGAVGLLGSLSGWNMLVTLVAAVVFGAVIGRGVMSLLRFVVRQQGTEVSNIESLVGSTARITIDTPAGKTGEAIIEEGYVAKYPVREAGNNPLTRGDYVEIVEIRNGTLYVKKKRTG